MLCGKRTSWGGKESAGLPIELGIPPHHGLDGERLKKGKSPLFLESRTKEESAPHGRERHRHRYIHGKSLLKRKVPFLT